MAYCTLEDIEKQMPPDEVIRLTDDDGAGTVDTDVVDRAIADAAEEIDAYLAVKYALPFETVPDLVRKMCVDLAICNLYSRKVEELPQARKDNCDKAVMMLDRIARGLLVLDVPDPSTGGEYGIGVTTSKEDRVFTRGTVAGGPGTLDTY